MKYIVIVIFFSVPIIGCKDVNDDINTIAIVLCKNQQRSNIFIFFNQDTTYGDVKLINGTHYFFVDSTEEVFGVKNSVSMSDLEYYVNDSNKLNRVFYPSETQIIQLPDTTFLIVGGALRGLYRDLGNGDTLIKYITFKSDFASKLKWSRDIPDDDVSKKFDSTVYARTILSNRR